MPPLNYHSDWDTTFKETWQRGMAGCQEL